MEGGGFRLSLSRAFPFLRCFLQTFFLYRSGSFVVFVSALLCCFRKKRFKYLYLCTSDCEPFN